MFVYQFDNENNKNSNHHWFRGKRHSKSEVAICQVDSQRSQKCDDEQDDIKLIKEKIQQNEEYRNKQSQIEISLDQVCIKSNIHYTYNV